MIEIFLPNGRKLNVDSFSMSLTYGGLLTFQTPESINRKIYERASYPLDWGVRKFLKMKPKEIDFKSFLDPCIYCAWLSSDGFNDSDDGSHLVVLWLSDLPNGKSIEQIVTKGIKSINWELNAESFNF